MKPRRYSMRKQTPKTCNDLIKLVKDNKVNSVKNFLANVPRNIALAKDENGYNALYYAILNNNIEIIRALLNYGFDPYDIDDINKMSALHIAAINGFYDLVVYLIYVPKMDVNVVNKNGENPLRCILDCFANGFDKSGKEIMDSNYVDIAWLLVCHGARFQDNMIVMFKELHELEKVLLDYLHDKIDGLCIPDFGAVRFIANFIQKALASHVDFCDKFEEEMKNIPSKNLFQEDAFKKSKHKIPVAIGWKIRDWDIKHGRIDNLKYPELLDVENAKPLVYDLTKITPLLINKGETEAETTVLFDNITCSFDPKLLPCDAKAIIIATKEDMGLYNNHYFIDTVFVDNISHAIKEIKSLSAEIDRRKALSKRELQSEKPIICFAGDIDAMLAHDKKIVGDIQNIAFSGNAVKVYFIAFNRGNLPSVVRANFQSIMTFKTATATESKKLIGHGCAKQLRLDEMFFVSPYVSDIQPLHIRMPK